MLCNMKKILKKAKQTKTAVLHFNINNLEWAKFILEACEEKKTPVILGVSEGAISYMGGYHTVSFMIMGMLRDLKITIPVVLHLDHGKSMESCKKAIEAGFTSVMIDASSKQFEENLAITKKVVTMAKKHNVSVEAELGYMEMDPTKYADVFECRKMKETGIDALAPAVGSVHGVYQKEPKLDLLRIREISTLTNLPLVLHGGTGIPINLLQKAVKEGICKININTELQLIWSKKVRNYLDDHKEVYDPRKIIGSAETEMKEKIKEYIDFFD